MNQNPMNFMTGFGNEFASEAIANTLPAGQNSPQQVVHGLYAEVLSGTAFTAPRAQNRRTWMYRQKPSVVVNAYAPLALPLWQTAGVNKASSPTPPEPMRWSPIQAQAQDLNCVTGMRTLMTSGDLSAQIGVGVHVMVANQSMREHGLACVNADADMLFVAQQGGLKITTELGVMQIFAGEVAHVPRGMVFAVDVLLRAFADGLLEHVNFCRAYVLENYGAAFRLPELGPIGSQGLANARDFLTPLAAFDGEIGKVEKSEKSEKNEKSETTLIKKFGGHFWQTTMPQTPFNVVAWHGNLVPYQYDLRRFNAIGSVSFDHPDPSIFTVLTSPSDTGGTANCDFVIFPPRWLVAEKTFRPPWYHRNVMSEFMGLIYGKYDAKEAGFVPGGMSLHNQMVPHGPDFGAFTKATNAKELLPIKLDNTMAFMFESRYPFNLSDFALTAHAPDPSYCDCWRGL